jgi:RHS repeat-associated protein
MNINSAVGGATTGPNAINKQVWTANTDPFGTSLGNSAPNENPQLVSGTVTQVQAATFRLNHRFPGQVFDGESGKHYNYFRDYDPSIGRYFESDPIGLYAGLNTYSYAANNPSGNTDAKGLNAATSVGLLNLSSGLAVGGGACRPCAVGAIIRSAIAIALRLCMSTPEDCRARYRGCLDGCIKLFEEGILRNNGDIRRCTRECLDTYGCYDY